LPHRVLSLVMVLLLIVTVGMFEFLQLRDSVIRVSAVQATGGIGVYWDPNCSNPVLSINWGVLSPGQTRRVVVYAHNEGNHSIVLFLRPANYSPANSSNYLNFTWNYGKTGIAVGETVGVTLSLYVSSPAEVTNFGFDIVFSGKNYPLGDLNGDGVVDILDAIILAQAFGSTPQDKSWNPEADLNNDLVVDIVDCIILAQAMFPR
jgi:hypothetical protein